MSKPVAVDPIGCGCTECITGLYIPLDQIDDEMLVGLLNGEMANNTSITFTVTKSCSLVPGETPELIWVKVTGGGYIWNPSPELFE